MQSADGSHRLPMAPPSVSTDSFLQETMSQVDWMTAGLCRMVRKLLPLGRLDHFFQEAILGIPEVFAPLEDPYRSSLSEATIS